MQLVTPPEELIALPEAKAWLRVDGPEEDGLIAGLTAAAVAHLDGWHGVLGRALGPQVWEMALDEFPEAEIPLPLGPVVRVERIGYIDPLGALQIVPPASYDVDAQGVEGWAVPVAGYSWPETMETINAVRLRWTCGGSCPEPVRIAIKMLIAHWYANREAVGGSVQELPLGVSALIAPFRRVPR